VSGLLKLTEEITTVQNNNLTLLLELLRGQAERFLNSSNSERIEIVSQEIFERRTKPGVELETLIKVHTVLRLNRMDFRKEAEHIMRTYKAAENRTKEEAKILAKTIQATKESAVQ
jgi:hypothetical protein